jgi:hypothetical protein
MEGLYVEQNARPQIIRAVMHLMGLKPTKKNCGIFLILLAILPVVD